MKIYVINLDRRPDRLERINRLAGELGFAFERVAAVDAKAADFAERSRAMRRDGPTGVMADSTIACTMSHLEAWRRFDADPSAGDVAIVLEDDVILSSSFGRATEALEAERLGGYGLVKLEAKGSTSRGAFLGRHAAPLDHGFALRRSYQVLTNSAAYALTREMAGRLERFERLVCAPVDHFLFYPIRDEAFWGGAYAVLDPAVAIQDQSSSSDIQSQRYADGGRRRSRRFLYESRQAPMIVAGMLRGAAHFRKIEFRA